MGVEGGKGTHEEEKFLTKNEKRNTRHETRNLTPEVSKVRGAGRGRQGGLARRNGALITAPQYLNPKPELTLINQAVLDRPRRCGGGGWRGEGGTHEEERRQGLGQVASHSLILGPYSRPMPRTLRWSRGGGGTFLWARYPCTCPRLPPAFLAHETSLEDLCVY